MSPKFDSKLFAATIQSRLLLQGISLRSAAKEIGVSASTLSRVTNGEVPDMENFAAIIHWLDVDVNQFFESLTNEFSDDDSWTALYYSLQVLGVSAELIEAIVTVIKLVRKPEEVAHSS